MTTATADTLNAQYFSGLSPDAENVSLMWLGPSLKIIGRTLTLDFPLAQVHVSPRVGGAQRFIALPDGAQLLCPDHPLLDRLPQEGRTEGVVAWLEQRWPVALLSIVVTLASVGLAYFVGLPAVAKHVAARIPIEYEEKLGTESVSWADGRMFEKSELSDEKRASVSERFAQLTRGLPLQKHYRLEFRKAPAIGANAFAFPGGTIVITDELINACESLDETAAILAHEIGHVEKRHALRHILQDSAVAALIAGVSGDVTALSSVVSGLPVVLAQMKYSRDFESEADDYAFDLMKRRKISPEKFATIMERMQTLHDKGAGKKTGKKTGEKSDESGWAFLSTHPITAERIARARAAAKQ